MDEHLIFLYSPLQVSSSIHFNKPFSKALISSLLGDLSRSFKKINVADYFFTRIFVQQEIDLGLEVEKSDGPRSRYGGFANYLYRSFRILAIETLEVCKGSLS